MQLVRREEWGAREPAANHVAEPLNMNICGVSIHHSANRACSSSVQCKDRVQNIQNDHIDKRRGCICIKILFLHVYA